MGGEGTADLSETTLTELTLNPSRSAGAVGGVPLSVRIRERPVNAGHRFHANDNIAAYLYDSELDLLQAEMEKHLQAVLRTLVIDVEQDHNSRETTRRVAKMFIREVFAGCYVRAPEVTAFPSAKRLNELMVVGSLRVCSICSHHLCPMMGHAWVDVIPRQNSQLVGLFKYARLIDQAMSRPQIQEGAIKQIADLLEGRMESDGLAIMLGVEHYCIHQCNTKDDESCTVSGVMRDVLLTDVSLRREFLVLLSGYNGG